MILFSKEERFIYQNNPLAEVICQLRFPEILSINTTAPAAFQEAIRDEYPLYSVRKEAPAPKILGVPGNFSLDNQPTTQNYHFVSSDGIWRINLTSRVLSLSCKKYTQWEDFAKRLDKPLAAFICEYKPAFFQRVGLRYLNFFSRSSLDLEDTPFRDLFSSNYLGPLQDPEVVEQTTSRCSTDIELQLRGGCHAKIHAGPGLVKRDGKADKELKFIFDMDLFMAGNIPLNHSAGALQTLHSQAYPIFRDAITDTLHDAMEPTKI